MNTGNFACSSCKFPDSKDQGYWDICSGILLLFIIYIETEYLCQVSFASKIVTNH